MKSLSAKVSTRTNRRVAGSTLGTRTATVRALALVGTVLRCMPLMGGVCRSCHTMCLDIAFNIAFRLITGCLRSTPTKYLPVLSGIAPAQLRREQRTYRLVTKATRDSSHLLNSIVEGAQVTPQRLKSRRPFSRHTAKLRDSEFNLLQSRKESWSETTHPAQFTVPPKKDFSFGYR